MTEDWRYNDDRMNIREQCLKILLLKYGSNLEKSLPKYSSQSIYECAHDWVSQGNNTSSGIIKYYEAYYT
jgi:hypothetical protein